MARVIANLVVGRNLATSLHGRSSALSFPADRARFHALRGGASAIVIGGATFRAEPYFKNEDRSNVKPLLVATKNSSLLNSSYAGIEFIDMEPQNLIESALAKFGAPILIEGGVAFITPLISSCQIDRLYLTRSPEIGDSDFFDEELLTGYQLFEEEVDPGSGGKFQTWIPKHPSQ